MKIPEDFERGFQTGLIWGLSGGLLLTFFAVVVCVFGENPSELHEDRSPDAHERTKK